MSAITCKSFDRPDETRTPPKATVAIVELNGATLARFTFQPGWRWSESIRPIAGTDTCQVHHLGVVHSGILHVVAADGAEHDLTPGVGYTIEPGHDAWVVGDTPVVTIEFDRSATAKFATPTP